MARVQAEEMEEMELLLIQFGARQLVPVKILEELIIMRVAGAEELGELLRRAAALEVEKADQMELELQELPILVARVQAEEQQQEMLLEEMAVLELLLSVILGAKLQAVELTYPAADILIILLHLAALLRLTKDKQCHILQK